MLKDLAWSVSESVLLKVRLTVTGFILLEVDYTKLHFTALDYTKQHKTTGVDYIAKPL